VPGAWCLVPGAGAGAYTWPYTQCHPCFPPHQSTLALDVRICSGWRIRCVARDYIEYPSTPGR
jgi:hypothetical protein